MLYHKNSVDIICAAVNLADCCSNQWT